MQGIHKFLDKARRLFDKVTHVERYLCAYLLIIMVAITFVQVVMRFVFSSPFSWAEEITLMLLVWFGYLCMALDIYTDSHAALYFLYNKMPPVVQKGADLFRHGILTWLFIELTKYGWQITKLNLVKPQPATRLSQGWLFAPLVFGGILMTVYAVYNLLKVIVKPLSEYKKEHDKTKTIDDMNIERGGTV